MLKKATEIEECVKEALKSQPDYSIAFTRRVSALAKRIQDALSASVEHDSDMNYGSGQKIVVWLNKTCRLVASRSSEAAYRLEDHVSSRGRLFTFVTLRLAPADRHWKERGLAKPGAAWIIVAESDIPAAMNRLMERIASVMAAERYQLLEGTLLSEAAEGQLTQLDAKPATVFEALFSEL